MTRMWQLTLVLALSSCSDQVSKTLSQADMATFINNAILSGVKEEGANPRSIKAFLDLASQHFIAKCPICEPVKDALSEYAEKGEDAKWSGSGSGFPKAIEEGLASSDRKARLQALQSLVDRYVSRALDRSSMTGDEKKQMKKLLEEAKQQGMEVKNKFLAEIYKDFGDTCPSCSGATQPRK